MSTYIATAALETLTITVSITPRVEHADALELTELAQMGLVHAVQICRRNNALPDPEKEMPF